METTAVTQFLEAEARRELLRFTTAGSVDDGKSTLIGRLLHDSKSIYEDQVAALTERSARERKPIDWALLTDGLKAEREQGITIDVAYRYFSTPKRKFIIADTPGHEQYTRNMVTGASTADLAIVLLDARHGVRTQSKRHAYISSLLRIPHMLVAVNKMDLVDFDEAVFKSIVAEFTQFANHLDVDDVRFVPISALLGDNVVDAGANMPWYRGGTLMHLLEHTPIAGDRNLQDFRFPVQSVARPNQDFRGYRGQVVSGVVKPGDPVTVLPSGTGSRVRSIVTFDGECPRAFPPMSVTLTLEDEIDISRGDMIVHHRNQPYSAHNLKATLVWMDEQPLKPGDAYLFKQTTAATRVVVDRIHHKTDVDTLSQIPSNTLVLNEIGQVGLTGFRPINFDAYTDNRGTGSFVLIHETENRTVAAGMILSPGDDPNHSPQGKPRRRRRGVAADQRAQILGHQAVTLLLHGSDHHHNLETAFALEHTLIADQVHAKVLEPDLFTEDHTEGRHAGLSRTAAILNEAGLIAVVVGGDQKQFPNTRRTIHIHLDQAADAGADDWWIGAVSPETAALRIRDLLKGHRVFGAQEPQTEEQP